MSFQGQFRGGHDDIGVPGTLRKTPCCGYEWHAGTEDYGHNKGPIFWNPYNSAVQCHNCGTSFAISGPSPAPQERTPNHE